jgi:tripartite motif-containing protein 71
MVRADRHCHAPPLRAGRERSPALRRFAVAALGIGLGAFLALLQPTQTQAAAAITTAPSAAAAGISFKVSGTGFAIGETVNIYWDDISQSLTSLTTSSSAFTTQAAVPSAAPPGPHQIIAEGSTSGATSTSFTVLQLPQFETFIGTFVAAEVYPISVVVPSGGPRAGQIYIGDLSNFRIRVYDAGGAFTGIQWGERGNESGDPDDLEVQKPADLAADSAGNIYEGDSASDRVQKFDPDGNLLATVGGARTVFRRIGGVAVDSSLGIVYVTSANAIQNVQEFDLNLKALGVKWDGSEHVGQGSLRFKEPSGLDVDSSGRLFLTDAGNDVIQVFDHSGNFFGRFGQQGSGKIGDFNLAQDVAVVSYPDGITDDVYVTDKLLNRVSKFTVRFKAAGAGPSSTNCPNGTTANLRGDIHVTCQGLFGGFDADPFNPQPGEMYAHSGIAVDAAGNIYVADLYNYRLQKFSAASMAGLVSANKTDANTVRLIAPELIIPGTYSPPGPEGFHDVRGVTVDSQGNVYGSDTSSHRVVRFASQPDGTYAPDLRWGRWGRDNGLMAWPRGLGVDSSDNIYVTDESNNRVQKFTSGGAFLTTYSKGKGSQLGKMNSPKATVVGPDGNVYVSDEYNSRVQVFQNGDPSKVLGVLGSLANKGRNMNQLWLPKGIATDPRGYGPGNGYRFALYVDDPYNCRVLKFLVESIPGSGVVTFLNNATAVYGLGGSTACSNNPLGFGFPYGAAVDSQGHVFIADETRGRIWQFDDQGNLMLYFGQRKQGFPFDPGQFSSPRNVAVDASDNVYIADTFHGTIQKFRTVQNPAISVTPDSATVKATVAVAGGLFTPGAAITLRWDGQSGPILATTPGTVTVNSMGAFAATFTVPAAAIGSHAVFADDGNGKTAQTIMTVKPKLRLSPSSGMPGSTAKAIFSGFGAGETVDVIWDYAGPGTGTSVASLTNDGNGSGMTSFSVPADASSGGHSIGGVGQTSGALDTATFTVP